MVPSLPVNPLTVYGAMHMTIYDRERFDGRTFIESLNQLFVMGKELEQRVQSLEQKTGVNDDDR